jgi:2'-5' RNA ligase
MRLFVGIEIPEEIRRRLLEHRRELHRSLPEGRLRWTRPEGWHITLKFIGESEARIDIQKALARVAHVPFEVKIAQAGFFTPAAPRIYYAGVEASAKLCGLASRVERALSEIGIPAEKSPYAPHLTLARGGAGGPRPSRHTSANTLLWPLVRLLEREPRLAKMEFGTMTVLEFHLYRSDPTSGGSEYTRLATFGPASLGGTDADRE